jgi:hypothetical protein
MTKAEMNRRLATLTAKQLADLLVMIEQGFGARGIVLERPVTLKQVNAVFTFRDTLRSA